MKLASILLQAAAAPSGGGGAPIIILIIVLGIMIYAIIKQKRKTDSVPQTSENKTPPLTIGISLVFIGIVLIIISQTVKFTKTRHEPGMFGIQMAYEVEDETTKNICLFCGIGLLAIGGLFVAKGVPNAADKTDNITIIKNNTPTTNHNIADEILKLKNLLDTGAITQQEFEEQKKKLLS